MPLNSLQGQIFLMNALEAKIRNYCLRLLKYRPHSKKEAEERLRRKGYPLKLSRKVLEEFVVTGLIDDRAFAKFWLNWRSEINPRSINFIRLELRQKGISEDLIAEILDSFSSEDEFQKAKALAQKRFEKLRNLEPAKIKSRLYSYLQRRGFAADIIFEVISEIFKKSKRKID